MNRSDLLDFLAQWLAQRDVPHPLRVAIDGIDAAGKTTLADELSATLRARGRPVLRASVDDFQQPRAVRYGRGRLSPEGYYDDAFDYAALIGRLLAPLGPGGNRWVETAVFHHPSDTPLPPNPQLAPANATLLCDGVFLLRPALRPYWDAAIHLYVSLETSLARALRRDAAAMGSAAEVRRRYQARYLPAQQHYLAKDRPQQHADIVIDNTNPAQPRLLRLPRAGEKTGHG
ncbi:MAG: hypothetical protein KC425_02820 [Anaerolineales bacterium]|nr:hypothetical protein [Anaerolineales bacterium]